MWARPLGCLTIVKGNCETHNQVQILNNKASWFCSDNLLQPFCNGVVQYVNSRLQTPTLKSSSKTSFLKQLEDSKITMCTGPRRCVSMRLLWSDWHTERLRGFWSTYHLFSKFYAYTSGRPPKRKQSRSAQRSTNMTGQSERLHSGREVSKGHTQIQNKFQKFSCWLKSISPVTPWRMRLLSFFELWKISRK